METPYQKQNRAEQARRRALRRAENAGIKILSRDEAIAAGASRYFDGKLCPKKHLSERYVTKFKCIACVAAETKAWRKKNPGRHAANSTSYVKKRCAVDPDYAMRIRTRAVVTNAMARMGYKKGSKTEAILGCTWGEFKAHLERQFLKGMNWDNRHLWHIDHIVPVSSASSEEEIVLLNHFTNLRPLWAEDNRKKADNAVFLL